MAPTSGEPPLSDRSQPEPWLLYSNPKKYFFLFLLFLTGASSQIDRNILSVLLPQIKAEFAVSDTELGLLSGIVFGIFYATLGIPLARWADRGNRAHILSLSLVVWSVMTMLCGAAQTFWQLVIARIGVGAGEAGAMPPAQSLIADYFSPEKRAGAMALFSMSSALGYAGGLIAGGYIAHQFGWRVAFMLVGSTGVIIAPLCFFGLKEPRRHSATVAPRETFWAALTELMRAPAYRYIVAAISIYYAMGYGALLFVVSLMMRLYKMNVQEAGGAFGLIFVLAALVGNVLGGLIGNRFAKRSLANLPRIAGIAMLVAVPIFEFGFSRPTWSAMQVPLTMGLVTLNIMLAPMYSSLHLVCDHKRRATAVAVALLFANLIGLGLGPFATGAISDHLAIASGSGEGLRSALMIVVSIMVVGGILMLLAARHIALDLRMGTLEGVPSHRRDELMESAGVGSIAGENRGGPS
jgi:predicted MFS family arabinose efflux permease